MRRDILHVIVGGCAVGVAWAYYAEDTLTAAVLMFVGISAWILGE